jgi:hypothetical protein
MMETSVVGCSGMIGDQPPPSDDEKRVVSIHRGRGRAHPPPKDPMQTDDLAKYAHGEGADDYRHRMLVNAAAFLFVMALIGAGLWLADTMAQMRRNQDCFLSGRRNCDPIEVTKDR